MLLALGILAYAIYRLGIVPGAITAAICALLAVVFSERRLDIDTGGITVVPLAPFRRSQRFPFDSLGRFAPRKSRFSAYSMIRASISPDRDYRLGGIVSRSVLDLAAVYGPPGKPPLTAPQLIALLEAYRT